KVDQSFVRDLEVDTYAQSFIRMVAELAETIGVRICVEGIETGAQLEKLDDMKIKYIQGYYFDKPLEREIFEKRYIFEKD
ncbi:MAG: EAL domain-containing protein, partial [Lachnospiraceae bacterium]|nr:EAL domain-containing protein [Lachnospiraceae bacterium]